MTWHENSLQKYLGGNFWPAKILGQDWHYILDFTGQDLHWTQNWYMKINSIDLVMLYPVQIHSVPVRNAFLIWMFQAVWKFTVLNNIIPTSFFLFFPPKQQGKRMWPLSVAQSISATISPRIPSRAVVTRSLSPSRHGSAMALSFTLANQLTMSTWH